MIAVAHLLDDFAMGGVTRALTLFEQPALATKGQSEVVPVDPAALIAPAIDADLIVDHMALSWRRLAFLFSLRARNPRARIVHVEHSYTRGFEQNQVAAPARFRSMIKLSALMVDRFLCVSKAQRDWLTSEVGVPKAKLQVIYPWSGRFELNDVPAAARRKHGPLRLLAYGRFAEVKNFEELINAMQVFSKEEVVLTLFGDGPDRQALEKMAAHLSHVTIEPPTNDIAKHLAQCDAVIVPSRYESFGLVATEARLAGRAILVADVDGLPEQVGSAGTVTAMQTSQEIVAAIRSALDLPLEEMGLAGRKEVATQHDQIIAAWTRLFEWAGAKQGKSRALAMEVEAT